MTKRIIHIIVSFVLLISTSGISISKHFMGSELFDISLFGDADNCCDDTCHQCQDEVQFFQLKVNFLTSSQDSNPSLNIIDLSPIVFLLADFIDQVESNSDHFISSTSKIYSGVLHFLSRVQVYRL